MRHLEVQLSRILSDNRTMVVYVFGDATSKLGNQRGLSLVEILITIGISAFLALASGLLVTQSTKEQNRLERGSNAKALADEIYSLCLSGNNLTSPCSFSGGSISLSAASSIDGVPITLQIPRTGGQADLTLSAGAQTNYGIVNRIQLAQLECFNRDPDGSEVGAATLRLSMQTGNGQNTKEVNVGRIPIRMTYTGSPPVCSGTRSVQPAIPQGWGAVSAALCQSMGLQLDMTGQRCRIPSSHIFGRTNPGPCAPDEHVHSIRADAVNGNSQAECREFPAQACGTNQLAIGFEAGNIACAAEPPTVQTATYPTVTQAPTATPRPPYQPPSPTPLDVPDPTLGETHNIGNYNCQAEVDYQNCLAAVAMGAATQFGITAADCGPAPTCYGNLVAQPTPNSATPYPTATPTPVAAVVTPTSTGSCFCGGQSVPNGGYCGYCIVEFDPEPRPYRNSYSLNNYMDSGYYNYPSSSVVQCVNGQLISSSQPYQFNLGCTGDYVNW